MVELIDTHVGRVVEQLEKDGELDNTVRPPEPLRIRNLTFLISSSSSCLISESRHSISTKQYLTT